MGLPALLDDYLFIGPLLAERVLDQVPGLPTDVVETAEQLYAADRRAVACFVMYAGERIAEPARAGGSQLVYQRWLTVVAVGNVSPQGDARQLRAGPLLSRLHKALNGWVPAGAVRPCLRVNSPLRPDIAKDKALYPLGFEIELAL